LRTRHTITYPYTHKWTLRKGATKTVFNLKTVNRDNDRKITVSSNEEQKLVLTKSLILADLPAHGSIDVSIHSESPCGKSSTVKMVICDTKVHESPEIEKSSDYGGAGETLDFSWHKTPADEKGHMYKLTWYTDHKSNFKYIGKVSR